MNINLKSQWNENQITNFLENANIPVRLSFLNKNNEPSICSLWFIYEDGFIWSASHKSSYLVNQLKTNKKIAFEISTNDYPYKGVRGKALAALSKPDAKNVLNKLISKYLDNSNVKLATWLQSRIEDEYAIKIAPSIINSWDFSGRMKK
jgi:nitroimidazol reductase NimA-like FMN-containing flavoprotein (pyridoxamine 5'-phosphate oxidase superfamily)